jgi:hypothetical protein
MAKWPVHAEAFADWAEALIEASRDRRIDLLQQAAWSSDDLAAGSIRVAASWTSLGPNATGALLRVAEAEAMLEEIGTA